IYRQRYSFHRIGAPHLAAGAARSSLDRSRGHRQVSPHGYRVAMSRHAAALETSQLRLVHTAHDLKMLNGLLSRARMAVSRSRAAVASPEKWRCHSTGASLLSPPCGVTRTRTRQITGVLIAAPATMA